MEGIVCKTMNYPTKSYVELEDISNML
jgi:hypothetical protein